MEYAWLSELSPVVQALLAGGVCWGVTACGAAVVFLVKEVSRKLLDVMEGFAAGVMIAASFWSLLSPAIEMARKDMGLPWLPAAVGFVAGGLVLWGLDQVLPHWHGTGTEQRSEGIRTGWNRSVLLVLAVTLHNLPEGLAVGVSFGAADAGLPAATLNGAVALALGIALQNFPEGIAVTLPLRRDGASRTKSFLIGQASAIVEPLAAVAGAAAVMKIQALLPYALSFAAGAMIFVVIEELIPDSHNRGKEGEGRNHDLATLGALAGFTVMMILDVAFG